MSYTAKRLILLLMGWGLIVFAGVTVRINGSQAPVVVPTTPTVAAAAPATTPSAAAGNADLQATLQRDPNNVPALVALAEQTYQAQDWAGAILLYQRIVALQPHDAGTLVRLAATQIYAGQISDARQTLEQAVQIAPDRADAHLLLGLTLSRAMPSDPAHARQEWQRVITLAPGTDLAQQAQTLLAAPTAQP